MLRDVEFGALELPPIAQRKSDTQVQRFPINST